MIIYGSKGIRGKHSIVIEKICMECFTTEHTATCTFEYIHLFYMPAWILYKVVILKCKHCGHLTILKKYKKEKEALE